MRIILAYYAFDAIMKATKHFVHKSTNQPILTQIRLQSENGVVTATALDGIKAVQRTVLAEDGTETGTMFIPWIKPIGKKNVYAEILDAEDSVTVRTVSGAQTFKKVRGAYIDTGKIWYEGVTPEATVYFNPKQIAEAFSAFADDIVEVKCFGDTRGIVVTGVTQSQKALVLPKRPPRKK